jgi:hypothetical protein
VLLQPRLQNGNRPFYRNWLKNSIIILLPTDGVLLKVNSRRERCCAWNLIATISHVWTLSMLFFQDSTDMSITFSARSSGYMTWLGLGIINSNQVHFLILSYHRAMSLLVLHVTSCIYLFLLAKHAGTPFLIMHWSHSCLQVPTSMKCAIPWHWNLKKFFSEHPIELMDQEDRVMEHNTRRVMKHSLILQGAISFVHERKSYMEDREVPPFNCLKIHGQCDLHHFLMLSPPLINLETRFL